MLVRFLPHILLTLLCLALAQAATAQPAADGSDVAAREVHIAAGAFTRGDPLPQWAQPLAEIPAAKRHDPIVIRLAETQLHADAKPALLVNFAEQANDNASLGSIGEFPLVFNPDYQTLHLHKLLIVRGAQVLDRTREANVRFLQRESELEQGMYSGAVTAMFLLDDIRLGDTLHLVYSIEGENPVFGGTYTQTASWDRTEPVDLRRVWLIHPSARPVQWRMVGDYHVGRVKPTVTEAGGVRKLEFEERNLDSIEDEPFTPTDYVPYRFLQFTEYQDWNGVARWASAMFPPVAELTPELQALVDRLRTLPTKEAQAAGALQWVQDEVRYFSVSLGESSHRPHLPAEVAQRRYGDCKDKTYLLVTLLHALDIEAHPVLLTTYAPRMPARLMPTTMGFDHVIVQARVGNVLYYLDGTRLGQHSALDQLGPTFPGARGLVVDAGTQALTELDNPRLHALVASELSEEFGVPSFSDDGNGTLTVKQTWHGSAAEFMRLSLSRQSAAQLRKGALSNYERRYPGIELAGDPVIDDDVAGNRFTLILHCKIPKLAAEQNGSWGLHYYPGNLAGIINVPAKAKRNFPLDESNAPYVAHYHLTVKWPDNVSAPHDPTVLKVKSDFFNLETQAAFRGNVATLDADFTVDKDRIEATDVPRFIEDVKKFNDALPLVAIVQKDEIKQNGILGLGRKTLQQSMQVRFLTEIDRASAALKANVLQGEDRAEALCIRASAYYNLGRYAEGLTDAEEAVKLAPSLAHAYGCRGDLYTATGNYIKAVADYTQALSLGGDPTNTFYSRGRSRIFAGQFEAAAADFGKALQADNGGGLYYALWQAAALQRAGKPLPDPLLTLAKRDPTGAWPRPALAMVAGALAPSQMLAEVNKKAGDDRELSMVEAQYYLGEYLLAQGRQDEAKAAFEQVHASGVSMYNEYVGAEAELKLLAKGK